MHNFMVVPDAHLHALPDVHAVDPSRAFVRLQEASQQVDGSGLGSVHKEGGGRATGLTCDVNTGF